MQIEGTLREFWEYARGKGVAMEFRKLGGRVFLRRVGRQLGDAAFAAPGTVQREASGFFKVLGAGGCLSYPLRTDTCGKRLNAPLDLSLGWSKGKLTLEESGKAKGKTNPAEQCGLVSGGSSFNQLSFPYPFLSKQRAKLPARKIFGSKRNLKLVLKDNFLEPLDPQGYTTFKENLVGSTTITLKRL